MPYKPTGVFLAPNAFEPKSYTRSYAGTVCRSIALCKFFYSFKFVQQAFYFPNKGRKNLTVLVNALVRNIGLVEASQGNILSAMGVEFEYDGSVYEVYANEEVILSAG